jgi:hypothetical protein
MSEDVTEFEARVARAAAAIPSDMPIEELRKRLAAASVYLEARNELDERQLSAARAALRTLCDDLGLPNDWPDDLHLADVVEKHIGDPLTPIVEAVQRLADCGSTGEADDVVADLVEMAEFLRRAEPEGDDEP